MSLREVLMVPGYKQMLTKFCIDSFLGECVGFLDETEILLSKRHTLTDEEMEQSCNVIFEKYFANDDLNVDSYVKNLEFNLIHTRNWNNVFKESRSQISLLLHEDVLPRFFRNVKYYNASTDPKMLFKNVQALTIPQNLLLHQNDLDTKQISSKIVDLGLYLKEDKPHWELIYADNICSAFCSLLNPQYQTVKQEYALAVLTSKDFIVSVTGGKYTGYTIQTIIPPTEECKYFHYTVVSSLNLGPLFKQRHIEYSIRYIYFPETRTCVSICKTYKLPKIKGKVLFKCVSFQFISELSPNKIKHTMISMSNLGGVLNYLPISIGKKEIVSLADAYHKNFKEKIDLYESENWQNQKNDITSQMTLYAIEKYLQIENIDKELWPTLDFDHARSVVENWEASQQK